MAARAAFCARLLFATSIAISYWIILPSVRLVSRRLDLARGEGPAQPTESGAWLVHRALPDAAVAVSGYGLAVWSFTYMY
jgi:hypothetical protein